MEARLSSSKSRRYKLSTMHYRLVVGRSSLKRETLVRIQVLQRIGNRNGNGLVLKTSRVSKARAGSSPVLSSKPP